MKEEKNMFGLILLYAVIGVLLVAVIGGIIAVTLYCGKLGKLRNEFSGIPENMTVTAHTGCVGTKMNSIEAIEVGMKYADIVEFDANFNDENVPVLSHDAPKGGEPTFENAMKTVAKDDSTQVNIDLKVLNDNLYLIQEYAEKYGLIERVFFTGVEEEKVEAVKAACPKIAYYLNYGIDKNRINDKAYIDEVIEAVKSTGAVGLNTSYKLVNAYFVSELQKAGLLVSLYTVNDEINMYKVISCKPDNITTKKPDVMRSLGK